MKINGRLLLLAVVTGLFIRIWSGADRTNSSSVAQQRHIRPVVESVVVELPPRLGREEPENIEPFRTALGVAVSPVESPDHSAAEQGEFWTEQSAPIPLPAELSAGVWRIVDDTGRVARLVVDRETVHGRNAPGFHTRQLQGRRWYFIRLKSAPNGAQVAQIAEPTAPADRQPTESTTSEQFETESVWEIRTERVYTPELLAEIADSRIDVESAAESAAEPCRTSAAILAEAVVETAPEGVDLVLEVAVPTPALAVVQTEDRPTQSESIETEVAVVPDCAVKNRKFDFTGFVRTAEPAVQVDDEDRPAPVDLPEVE